MTTTPKVDAPLEIRLARLEELIELRHVMLRQGMPRESAVFEGDDFIDSRHYGAFLNGTAVACATLHSSHWEGEPAWQLRGMAVAAEHLRSGLGRAILGFLETDLRVNSPVSRLWCNARFPAVGFYQKQGWEIRSEIFDIPTAGPHVRMTRQLSP